MISNSSSSSRPWLNLYPPEFKWSAAEWRRPVYSLLDEIVKKYGSSSAMDFMGNTTSWREIHKLSCQLARGLQDLGMGRGTRIGICLPNTPYFLAAYYGILRTGATAVHINPLYPERELAHIIEDSGIDVLITLDLKFIHDKMLVMLQQTRLNQIIVCPMADALPLKKKILFSLFKSSELARIPNDDKHLPWERMIDNNGHYEYVDVAPDDIALLQYTGGTTGAPKGAMLTHANIVANTEQAALWFYNVHPGQDKMLGVIPFFHVFAMTAVMNLAVRFGLEIIALPRFDLEQTLDTITKEKPTVFPAVPAIFNAINHADLKGHDLSSLRYCVSGGASLPVETKKSFEGKTGCILVEGYGLTEASPVVCVNPLWAENKPGSIGLPLPETDVSLRDPETLKEMAKGERGELWVKGPQIMKGYWRKPEDTEKTFHDGWLRTGDIAIIDEQGYVFIVDRLKDMIITNGYNVYPRNVEEVIYLHPAVEECVVAGIPDESRGEIVKAWIKLKDGASLTQDKLKEFMKDKLSPMEIPKLIEIRNQPLPKTMIGKLSKKDLLAEEKQK
ncbi:MAG: AMP-binding protein [Alphaproteobacteria bacterium]|nr:AMP-binding protein [Alphaproteobacteria bacterium]